MHNRTPRMEQEASELLDAHLEETLRAERDDALARSLEAELERDQLEARVDALEVESEQWRSWQQRSDVRFVLALAALRRRIAPPGTWRDRTLRAWLHVVAGLLERVERSRVDRPRPTSAQEELAGGSARSHRWGRRSRWWRTPLRSAPAVDAAEGTPEPEGRYVPPLGLLPWFDPLNLTTSRALAARPHLNVLLPSTAMRHMSGGPNTAIALALALADRRIPVRFLSSDAAPDPDSGRFWSHACDVAGLERRPVMCDVVDAHDRRRPVSIGENDLFLATAWWTAQHAKYAIRHTNNPTFLYLVQDFEPSFLPASSGYALALETYALDHVPIVNTSLLCDFLGANGVGRFADPGFAASALVFEPALDRRLYHPRETETVAHRRRLLVYARPTNGLRNLFELGVATLQAALAEGVLDPGEWDFVGIGESFAPVALGRGATLSAAPWLDLDGYAELLRESDILLSGMLSPHPSYPPLEMAASGGIVVTTEYANKTAERLATWSNNIIGTPATIEGLTGGLAEAVRRSEDWEQRRRSADVALPESWAAALEPVLPSIVEHLAAAQGAPPLPARMPFAREIARVVPGYPEWPRTRLDVHRRDALRRRRFEYQPRPEDAFLSLLTPVWNTDPRFLEELAECVLAQDATDVGFEWVIVDDASTRRATRDRLDALAREDRVRFERMPENLGIVAGLRACLERATCRYVAIVDHDDLISPDCVRVLASAFQDADYPPIAYSDEDKLDVRGARDAYAKPGWDPVLFANQAYIAHLGVFDRALALELGVFSDPACEGSADWDAFVRFVAAGYVPHHVPELLYTWRMHRASTSQRMDAKPFVADSQRAVVSRLLDASPHPERYVVEPSPLFDSTPDWWIRRTPGAARAITTVVLGDGPVPECATDEAVPHELVDLRGPGGFGRLAAAADRCAAGSGLLHILYSGVTIENEVWPWEAMTQFELFPDTAMVGGRMHCGGRVVAAGAFLGFGDACDAPDLGRVVDDPGYVLQMWKPHSVSAVPAQHAVLDPGFLRDALAALPADASLGFLGAWLGGIAREWGKRVVYSPFFESSVQAETGDAPSKAERGSFRRAFLRAGPERRFLSPHLGLSAETAYELVTDVERRSSLVTGKPRLTYGEWLDADRSARRVTTAGAAIDVTASIVTSVYAGSPVSLFEDLADSVFSQTLPPSEWVLVLDGPVGEELELAVERVCGDDRVRVVRLGARGGIIGALRAGLEAATGEYVLPVDGDDLLELDAWQVMASFVRSTGRPDYLYSDEDVLSGNVPESPYLRPDFDPVLNLESSYIWHLSCFRREAALDLGAYTDPAAELCQDFDTTLRFGSAGRRFEHVPHVLYHWRKHGDSQSHSGRQNAGTVASVRAVLERTVASFPGGAQRYGVRPFPIDRGAEEWQIERLPVDLPAVVAVSVRPAGYSGRPTSGSGASNHPDVVLDVSADDPVIDTASSLRASAAEYVLVLDASASPLSQEGILEAVKLLELHRDAALVGGRLLDGVGRVVDAGSILDEWGLLVPAYHRLRRTDPGPWAIALKAQCIAAPASGLFFARGSFLDETADELPPDLPWRHVGAWLGGRARATERRVAYSPLIEGRVAQRSDGDRGAPERSQSAWRGGLRGRSSPIPPIFGDAAFRAFAEHEGKVVAGQRVRGSDGPGD